MRKGFLGFIAAGLSIAAASAQQDLGLAGEGAPRDPAALERFIDGYVAAAMADRYPPGLTIAVATPEAEFVKAYGVSNIETDAQATPDTLFRIASISKTFVWVSVMMLVDEGRLDLFEDVNVYLKAIKVPEAFGAPVTLNDLMAHRAGFEDTFGDFFESRTGRPLIEAMKRHAPKRVAPPGERTSYSNWGTDLAALIVEDVSGAPYDEFVRTRILSPLGMESTVLHDPETAAGKRYNDPTLDARIAAPHKLDAGAPAVMAHDALDPIYAAGAISMSARDAATWIRFFLRQGAAGDGRLLSPEAFALMRTRNFTDRLAAPDFAHGFMEAEIAGHATFGHGGTLSGFISDLTIAPDLGIGVLVSVNGAENPRLPDALSRAVIEQWARADPYPRRWPAADDAAKARAKEAAGVYVGNRMVHSKFERVAALGGDLQVAAKEDGSIAVAAGGEVRRYYPKADDYWSDGADDGIFLYRDGKGKPLRIANRMGTDTAERATMLETSQGFNLGVGAVSLMSVAAFTGLWRRIGRGSPATGVGRALALVHLGSAALWLAFIGVLTAATAAIGAMELAELQAEGWPPPMLGHARTAAHAAGAGAAASLLLLIPAVTASGWSIWRKLHYALFAIVGGYALFMLWRWNLVLAPMTVV
jgi:CubicO group peptidase (beta-lactamase class C family)